MTDRERLTLSRRQALLMLTSVAGAGAAAAWRSTSLEAVQTAGSQRAATPAGAVIRTILKDLSPSAVGNGPVLFHEHMSFNSGFFEKMRPANAPRPATPPPPSYLEDVNLIIEEVKASGKDGVSLIVDGGHPDMGTSYDRPEDHRRAIRRPRRRERRLLPAAHLSPRGVDAVRGSARRGARARRRQVPLGRLRRDWQLTRDDGR